LKKKRRKKAMLSSAERQRLTNELKDKKNIQEVFDYLSENYDLKRAEMSFLTKPKIIDGLLQAIHILNPPKKK
jgi:hypothetical protein